LCCCAVWCSGDSGSATHICLAGEQCGATLLPTKAGGQGPPPYAHGLGAYFGLYGTGQFDGQNSGHDYLGTVSFSFFSRVGAGSRPKAADALSSSREYLLKPVSSCLRTGLLPLDRQHQQLRRWPLAHVLRLQVNFSFCSCSRKSLLRSQK